MVDGRTLSEIISGAIGEADQEIKLASARDALPVDFEITPDSLVRAAIDEARVSAPAAEEPTKTASAQPAATSKTASRQEVLTDAEYAMKLAEALDNAGLVVEKIATMIPERAETKTPQPGGLPNTASGHMESTKDTNTKATTLSQHEAFTGGDSGSGPKLETFKSPHAEGGKTASDIEAATRAKQAALVSASMPAKVAASPADHPGSLPIDPPVSGGVAPDNARAASMTQRDAKSREKGEISKHVSEPAFSATSDAGLKDNTLNAGAAGAKIAAEQEPAMRAMLQKIASKKNDPNATPEDLAKVARLEQALRAKNASAKNPSDLLG